MTHNYTFPPDSRTGSQAPAMIETADGQLNPYGNEPPSVMQHQNRGVNIPADTVIPINNPGVAQQLEQDVEHVSAGSALQEVFGTELYFQFIDFSTTQAYHGVRVEDMDRMDLMAAFGRLVGEFYQSEAQQAQPPAQQAQPQQRMPQVQQPAAQPGLSQPQAPAAPTMPGITREPQR